MTFAFDVKSRHFQQKIMPGKRPNLRARQHFIEQRRETFPVVRWCVTLRALRGRLGSDAINPAPFHITNPDEFVT